MTRVACRSQILTSFAQQPPPPDPQHALVKADFKVTEGETMSMHLIIKLQAPKATGLRTLCSLSCPRPPPAWWRRLRLAARGLCGRFAMLI